MATEKAPAPAAPDWLKTLDPLRWLAHWPRVLWRWARVIEVLVRHSRAALEDLARLSGESIDESSEGK